MICICIKTGWHLRGGESASPAAAPGPHTRIFSVQVIADPAGRLIWASPALPGARHDMGAAAEHGILAALNDAGVIVVADNGGLDP